MATTASMQAKQEGKRADEADKVRGVHLSEVDPLECISECASECASDDFPDDFPDDLGEHFR